METLQHITGVQKLSYVKYKSYEPLIEKGYYELRRQPGQPAGEEAGLSTPRARPPCAEAKGERRAAGAATQGAPASTEGGAGAHGSGPLPGEQGSWGSAAPVGAATASSFSMFWGLAPATMICKLMTAALQKMRQLLPQDQK